MSSNPSAKPLNVLLLHQATPVAEKLKVALGQLDDYKTRVTEAGTWEEGLKLARAQQFDIVFFDLPSVASFNLMLFVQFHLEVPFLPVVILVPRHEALLGKECIQAGAQDWLPYESLAPEMVNRAITYSKEIHQAKEALRAMSLVDPQTGLYNMTGFEAMTYPQMQMAKRTNKTVLLVTLELVNTAEILEQLGPGERQNAMLAIGQLLWKSIRGADILARTTLDSFAVLANEATITHGPVILQRLRERVAEYYHEQRPPFRLKLRAGLHQPDLQTMEPIADMLVKAQASSEILE